MSLSLCQLYTDCCDARRLCLGNTWEPVSLGVALSWISWLCHLSVILPHAKTWDPVDTATGAQEISFLSLKRSPTPPHPASLLRSDLIGCFRDGVLPRCPCWPWTSDPSALPSQVLGSQECATMPAQMIILNLVRGAGRDAGKHLP